MTFHAVIARTTAFAGLCRATLDRLAATAKARELARGDYLWHAGDPAVALTIIRAGLVKVVKPGPNGRRTIVGLFGAPETVGDAAVLRSIPYPADALVMTNTASLVEIPRQTLLEVLDADPRLSLSCASAVQNKLTALLNKIEILSAGAVEVRLATLLLSLYERFGDELEDNSKVIPLALSRQELADLVSTSFETAIRVMTRWEREDVVATTPNGFLIRDREQLERIGGRDRAGAS
ncbi:MAG TPA: Crp/Fnr family transcriptional regulator [Polyangiaceae bacterium]